MQTRETAALYRIGYEDASAGDGAPAGVKAAAQIRSLKLVPDDWHHTEPSSAPDLDGLEWLAARFEQDYPASAPPAYIFPDPEGTVTALWKISGEIQVEVEFNLETRTAERRIHSISALTAQHDVVDLKAAAALSDIMGQQVRECNSSNKVRCRHELLG